MSTDSRFAEARTAYLDGRYMAALDILNGLIDTATDARPMMLLADTLASLGMPLEAAEAFRQAAGRSPDDALVCLRRAAQLYLAAGQDDEAQLIALKLLGVAPDDPTVAFILASLFLKSGETQLVDAVKNKLVASDDPEHLRLAMRLIGDDLRNENNLELFARMRRLFPDDPFIRMTLLGFAREFCDFDIQEREETALVEEIAAGQTQALAAESPHYNIMWCADEALNRLAANVQATPISAAMQAKRRNGNHQWADRTRIGYLSSDFWDDHATMRLFQSVLTRHDPARFDVTLFCYTPERFVGFDGGNRRTWGRIVPIGGMSDAQAEAEIRRHGIDILVDLKGHTGGARPGIMNRMAAPVQVAWLGFPGSVVHVDCDYVIGDAVVLPESARPHYHEKFCRLPDTYQPNDPIHRPLPAATPRAALGLPENAFVFASFNSPRKINRLTMTLWARILRETPASLLWLMCDSPMGRRNIEAFIAREGIATGRIVFAPKMAYAGHVARLQAADLGLDTFPCNGHTTTSDKLWAGLPVVTARGSNFASRVSESLLRAIGMDELTADDHDGFVDLAVSLANDRARLATIRDTLVARRMTAPLFDADRFCRHLETGYAMMAARARAGELPDHLDVPALAPESKGRSKGRPQPPLGVSG